MIDFGTSILLLRPFFVVYETIKSRIMLKTCQFTSGFMVDTLELEPASGTMEMISLSRTISSMLQYSTGMSMQSLLTFKHVSFVNEKFSLDLSVLNKDWVFLALCM